MARVIVFQHVAYELLGTLDPLLKERGIRIRYVNFGRYPDAVPSIEGYDAMIILGGPMNVDQMADYPHLATEIQLIQQGLESGMPMLGICLGAQLIARATGASVVAQQEKEIGWMDVSVSEAAKADPLLRHLSPVEKIFQWHGDTFELPRQAVHLAKSDRCQNQAFRLNDQVYGFQFHLEVDALMIDRWLNVPEHKAEIERSGGRIDPERIRADTQACIARSRELSLQVFGEFCHLIGHVGKMPSFPSR